MPRRHPPIPRIWMMTDERMGEALWPALGRLPRGSGVVFRHYAAPDRAALLRRVAVIAARRGLRLVVAGGGGLHVHNARRRIAGGIRTASAHSRREAIAAIRAGADAVFVSPVFATRSHPGAKALGRSKLGLMIRGLPVPVIALGGMNPQRARGLPQSIHGWAGIDVWL